MSLAPFSLILTPVRPVPLPVGCVCVWGGSVQIRVELRDEERKGLSCKAEDRQVDGVG